MRIIIRVQGKKALIVSILVLRSNSMSSVHSKGKGGTYPEPIKLLQTGEFHGEPGSRFKLTLPYNTVGRQEDLLYKAQDKILDNTIILITTIL